MLGILIFLILIQPCIFILGFEYGWYKAHKEYQKDIQELNEFYEKDTEIIVNKIVESVNNKNRDGENI